MSARRVAPYIRNQYSALESYEWVDQANDFVDRAMQAVPDFPKSPVAYDETLLPAINDSWKILTGDDQAPQQTFEKQMAFNAAVVEHLNRNVAGHRDAHAALERA